MHLVVQFLFTLASEAENFQKWDKNDICNLWYGGK